ncbi:uncharacterized protein LOC135682929 [Rhopilema esculentum]|uniref:uncharacterized protein LOC135682929 n=1 Tax=Rhopilema esculentum TaxID=499914 RepID=UPI0031D48C16
MAKDVKKKVEIPKEFPYLGLILNLSRDNILKDLRIILGQKLPDSWELDELLGVFGEELNLREKCAFAPISGPSTTNTQEQKLRNFKTPATQGYQSTTSTLVSNVYPTQYIFCNKKHFSASCATVTDPTTRKNILGEKKRCFVCLRSGHLSRNCHSTGKCFHCGESHHAAICSSNSVRKHQREVFSSEASRGDTAPRVNTTEHVNLKSLALEAHMFLKGMHWIRCMHLKDILGPLVKEMCTDGHTTIASLMAKHASLKGIFHSKDVWHKTNRVTSKLFEVATKKAHQELLPWISAIRNHF